MTEIQAARDALGAVGPASFSTFVDRVAGHGLPSADLRRLYEPNYIQHVTQAPNNTHQWGTSLKYGEWRRSETNHHLWIKPDHPSFVGCWLTVISGGGAGGSGHGASGFWTGGGGDGGAVALGLSGAGMFVPAGGLPSALHIIVGRGGDAGGWTSGSTSNFGGILGLTSNHDGEDGGPSALLTPAQWSSLSGSTDAAKLSTFLGLSYANQVSGSLVHCEGGFGGRTADQSNFLVPNEARGDPRNRAPGGPQGPRVVGGFWIFEGASGAGGGNSEDIAVPLGGGVGGGGSAGGAHVDGIFKNFPHGNGLVPSQLAGSGSQAKGPIGYHDGGVGGLFGGGGSGGQWRQSAPSSRRIPGGFGAPGVVEIVERWQLP